MTAIGQESALHNSDFSKWLTSGKMQIWDDHVEILPERTVFRTVGHNSFIMLANTKHSPKMVIPHWKFPTTNYANTFFSILTTVTICLEGRLEGVVRYVETLQENKRRNKDGKLHPMFSLPPQNQNILHFLILKNNILSDLLSL